MPTKFVPIVCPEDGGQLYELPGSGKLYCPNQGHDGRPSSAEGGARKPTSPFPTLSEIDKASDQKEDPEWLS